MHSVIRHFTGAPGLADELKARNKEIEAEISGVPGFIAYYLLKTSDGIASVTVCENSSGCEESTKRATGWLRENMPNVMVSPPHIITGEVAIKFSAQKTPAS